MEDSSVSSKISMGCIGLSPSDPSREYWTAQEIGSKSTLDRIDEDAHPSGSIKVIIAKLDSKDESTFDLVSDLTKLLSVAYGKVI
jgi:hypothetical protein